MQITSTFKRRIITAGLVLAAILLAFTAKTRLRTAQDTRPDDTIAYLAGVWIEGPGFDVTYGGTYDGCAARCLANPACVLIEYYRPEQKCNLYDALRPRLTGGESNVGIRRPKQQTEKP